MKKQERNESQILTADELIAALEARADDLFDQDGKDSKPSYCLAVRSSLYLRSSSRIRLVSVSP